VLFSSKRIKEKFFKRWRNAMPKVSKEKKARETDRHNTLGGRSKLTDTTTADLSSVTARHFEIWIKTYQAKTIRKAVLA
jgi:protein SFI1